MQMTWTGHVSFSFNSCVHYNSLRELIVMANFLEVDRLASRQFFVSMSGILTSSITSREVFSCFFLAVFTGLPKK